MPNRFSIFAIFLLAYFLSYFFRSTNAIIADDLVRDLALSPQQLGSMTGLFFAVFALVQFPLGFALDRLGARLSTGVLVLFAVLGSLVFATAQSYSTLALGRALIGLGMAGALMGSLAVLSRWFPRGQFTVASGVFVALGASGALLATTPLEALSNSVGWRQVFVGGAAIALLSSVLILLFTRNQPKGQKLESSQQSQGSPVEILGKLAFWQIAFLTLAVTGSFFAYQSLWLGPYLSDVIVLESGKASQLLFLLSAASIFGYFVSGWLANRLGLIRSISFAAAIFFSTQFTLAFFTKESSTFVVALTLCVFGFTGAFNIMIFSHLRHIFPDYLRGRSFTFTNFFGFAGIALMQWLLGIIVGTFPLSPTGTYAPEAFRTIFLLTSGLGLLSVCLYLPFLRPVKEM